MSSLCSSFCSSNKQSGPDYNPHAWSQLLEANKPWRCCCSITDTINFNGRISLLILQLNYKCIWRYYVATAHCCIMSSSFLFPGVVLLTVDWERTGKRRKRIRKIKKNKVPRCLCTMDLYFVIVQAIKVGCMRSFHSKRHTSNKTADLTKQSQPPEKYWNNGKLEVKSRSCWLFVFVNLTYLHNVHLCLYCANIINKNIFGHCCTAVFKVKVQLRLYNHLSSWERKVLKKKDQWTIYRTRKLITDKPYFLFTSGVIK